VLDAALRQEIAGGEPGLARPDYDGINSLTAYHLVPEDISDTRFPNRGNP
jgi:hypothetical protein